MQEMTLHQDPISGLYYRPDTSDFKSIQEVIHNNGYERKSKKFFTLEPDDVWLDIGGCIGAFTAHAARLCKEVTVFEPYSLHFDILSKNVAEYNNVTAVHAGLTAASESSMQTLYLNTKRGNTWRNSTFKSWQGGTEEDIALVPIENVIDHHNAVKLDAEGAEKELILWMLENDQLPEKLVFEWSWDIHKETKPFFEIMDRLAEQCAIKGMTKNYRRKLEIHEEYPPAWFPPCSTIFCKKLI